MGLSEHGITISGSLTKFLAGTNLRTLSRLECRQAFEMMADTLLLPIHRAIITRIDIGANLITDQKPRLYYPYFGESRYYSRLAQPNSINYQNSLRCVKAYDKVAECRSKGVVMPEVYAGKNLLRFEVCFMQRLPKQFNQAAITPDTLTDDSFYTALIDRWYHEYNVIKKIGLPRMDKSKIRTPTDFKQLLFATAIHYLGPENLLNLIEEMKAGNCFNTERSYYRIRDEIRSSFSLPFEEQTELIQELNNKMAKTREIYK